MVAISRRSTLIAASISLALVSISPVVDAAAITTTRSPSSPEKHASHRPMMLPLPADKKKPSSKKMEKKHKHKAVRWFFIALWNPVSRRCRENLIQNSPRRPRAFSNRLTSPFIVVTVMRSSSTATTSTFISTTRMASLKRLLSMERMIMFTSMTVITTTRSLSTEIMTEFTFIEVLAAVLLSTSVALLTTTGTTTAKRLLSTATTIMLIFIVVISLCLSPTMVPLCLSPTMVPLLLVLVTITGTMIMTMRRLS